MWILNNRLPLPLNPSVNHFVVTLISYSNGLPHFVENDAFNWASSATSSFDTFGTGEHCGTRWRSKIVSLQSVTSVKDSVHVGSYSRAVSGRTNSYSFTCCASILAEWINWYWMSDRNRLALTESGWDLILCSPHLPCTRLFCVRVQKYNYQLRENLIRKTLALWAR